MAINRKRDFKKLSLCIQEFLSRLPCDETTGFLRDTLYLTLLELHKYYLKEKDRLNLSLRQSYGKEAAASTTNHAFSLEKYERRWHGYDEHASDTKSQGFFAAQQGNIEDLKNKVWTDDVDALGQTYLMYAVHGNSEYQVECIEYLLSLKINIDRQATDGTTAMHLACQNDQKKLVVTLLKNKASTALQDKKGRAPLHWAALSSSSDIIKLLLQNGAKIDIKDCDSMTPAMWACQFNKLENFHVLKHALERIDPRPEAILDETDSNGSTVLQWAIPSGDSNGLECLKDLLATDVSHIRNNEGRTVLHTAATKGSALACELILSVCGKAILNSKDHQGQTALHLATMCGHGEVVDFLLRSGADSSDTNSSGRTALQEAEWGHYHYCLLVFAAFEQMKVNEKNKPPINTTPKDEQRNARPTKNYDSWVIPTDLLQDCREVTDETSPRDSVLEKQLVDVTEMKGFEVNESLVSSQDTAKTENVQVSGMNENHAPSRSNQNTPLQRSRGIEDKNEHSGAKKLEKSKVVNKENAALIEELHEEELQEYSSRHLQEHGSALSLTSNNSSEGDYSISENIEISSLGGDTDDESRTEEKQEHLEKGKGNKALEKKSNGRNIEESEGNPSVDMTNGDSTQDLKGHRGNLAPIKPLTPASFSIPAKLDPIPLSLTSKTNVTMKASQHSQPFQPRGIVAPLQPPSNYAQKEHSRPVLLRDKRQQSDTGNTQYPGSRGPGHGPLAQSHGKALLNNVLQDIHRKPEQKTPEIQKRAINSRSGKLPHPPRH